MAQDTVAGDRPLSRAAAAASTIPPAGFREWWMVSVLFLVYVCSFIDRGGITLLVAPIKADLGLSDVQMSLLLGPAFSFAYGVVSIPAGYLADMFSRRALIGGGIVIWSCMSASCGFAGTFWPLFFGRNGLATAEAILAPSAHSMIRDGFPPESRGRAFSVYTMATGLGTAAGLVVAGTLIRLGDAHAFESWPIIGHFKTWQIVLSLPGMCTIPLALIMMTVREPVRRASLALRNSMPSWGDTFRYLKDHYWVYAPFFGFLIIGGWANEGFGAWMPTALNRGWGIPPSFIGHVTGTIALTCGLSGLLLGSLAMDWGTKRGFKDAPLRLLIVGRITGLVCNLTLLHVGSHAAIFALMGLARFAGGAGGAATALTLSLITPSRLMGRLTSFMFLSMYLLGSTGATAVALFAKYAFPGTLGLIPAITIFYGVVETGAICLIVVTMVGLRRFQRAYEAGTG